MQNTSLVLTLGVGSLAAFLFFFAFYRVFNFRGKVAAVLTAVVMLIFYMPLAVIRWPGLDVFAIHFAFFMMISYGLGMITGIREKRFSQENIADEPWFHWGPAIIIIFFLLVAVVDSIIITLATKGLEGEWTERFLPEPQQFVKRLDDESRELQRERNKKYVDEEYKAFFIDELAGSSTGESKFPGTVAYDMQDREADYNAYLKRLQTQKERGWRLDGGWQTEPVVGQEAIFQINLVDKSGVPIREANVEVDFLRPSNKKLDQQLLLKEVDTGVYQGQIALSAPGIWRIEIHANKKNDLHEIRGKTNVLPENL